MQAGLSSQVEELEHKDYPFKEFFTLYLKFWKMSEKLPTHSTMAVSSEPLTPTSTLSSSVEKPSFQVPNDVEAAKVVSSEWKPQKQEYLVMLALSIISLMVALDATILVPVLSVSLKSADLLSSWLIVGKDNSYRSPRECHRFFLGRYILPIGLRGLSAFYCSICPTSSVDENCFFLPCYYSPLDQSFVVLLTTLRCFWSVAVFKGSVVAASLQVLKLSLPISFP